MNEEYFECACHVKLEKLLDKMDLDETESSEEKWEKHVGQRLVKQ